AGFCSGADHDEALSVELFGNRLCFLAPLEVARLELDALGLELLLVGLAGAQRLALRQKEVARKAVLHLHHVAHLAEAWDTFQKNDFHRSVSFLPADAGDECARQARKRRQKALGSLSCPVAVRGSPF